jgi:hypothetical protein
MELTPALDFDLGVFFQSEKLNCMKKCQVEINPSIVPVGSPAAGERAYVVTTRRTLSSWLVSYRWDRRRDHEL